MDKVAIARFTDPHEALIAAGALRARGFDAEVFDHNHGQVNWAVQQAVGCRLMVAEGQEREARAALTEMESAPPEPEEAPPKVRPGRYLKRALMALLFGVS